MKLQWLLKSITAGLFGDFNAQFVCARDGWQQVNGPEGTAYLMDSCERLLNFRAAIYLFFHKNVKEDVDRKDWPRVSHGYIEWTGHCMWFCCGPGNWISICNKSRYSYFAVRSINNHSFGAVFAYNFVKHCLLLIVSVFISYLTWLIFLIYLWEIKMLIWVKLEMKSQF